MTERIVFTPEAGDDVVAAYAWYERQELGLGEDFLRCVAACTESIKRHPRLYQVVFEGFRRALVRRFPFELFYEITNETIVIYSVFHCAQDPARWRQRLDSR